MKRLLMLIIFSIASIGLTVGNVSTGRGQTPGNAEDVQAIKKIILQMTDGMNKNDAKEIADVYTPDGDLITILGQWLRGRPEIERVMGAVFQGSLRKIDTKTLDLEIRFIRPDVALAYVTNEITGATDPKGQPYPPQRELSIRVFVKDSGVWQVAAFHNTIACPPESISGQRCLR
jgi:uncharacterized protein (TIGR02246 family)